MAGDDGGRGGQGGNGGAFLIVGYICAVTAMRSGDVGLVAPFRYTSLLWAILLGFLAFGDLPDGECRRSNS
jgi:drug/metabolite transporter (DMT)-like permease